MPSSTTIVFPEPGTVEIVEREIDPPGDGEVLIDTDRTLVSTGTELTLLSGEYPPNSAWGSFDYPHVAGYNNVGTVAAVGDDVTGIDTGDRVATFSSHAERVVVEAADCRPVPDGVSDDEAAFFAIAEIVMNGLRRGRLTWGETAAVHGLGLLGQFVVRLCAIAGAETVVGFDPADERREYLPSTASIVGADPTERDPAAVVADATSRAGKTADDTGNRGIEVETPDAGTARAIGRAADVAFEVTGNPEAIPGEFDVLREQGRLVLLSSPRGPTELDFHDRCNAPSHEIIGAHNTSHPSVATPNNPWTRQRHADLFFSYLARGDLPVESLVSHRKPFGEAPAVYDTLLDDRTSAMGVLFEW